MTVQTSCNEHDGVTCDTEIAARSHKLDGEGSQMTIPMPPNLPKPSGPLYRFGQFELHAGDGELVRNGHSQRLPEQPLQMLLALLERPGEVVSREALRERLWPGNTYVDFELGLNAAMKRLRQALRDDAVNPRFIETLPKRGYRLIAPVAVEQTNQLQTAEAMPARSECEPYKIVEPRKSVPWFHWIIWPLVGACILALCYLGWVSLLKPPPVRNARRYSVVLPEGAALAPASFMPLGVGRPNVAISRNGDQIVYSAAVGNTTELFLRDNSGTPAHPLPGTEDAHSPFFSPDGKWIGFFAESKLKKIRADGGPAIALCDVVLGFGGFWTEDDTIYFTPGEKTAIYRIAASGGVPVLATGPPARPVSTMYWPQMLPGGEAILFANSRWNISVYDLRNRKTRILTRGGSSPRWSSTGHVLYVDDGILWAMPFDPKKLEKTGPSVALQDHVRMELQGAAQYDISQDGTLVYASGGDVAEASLVWLSTSGRVENVGLPPRRYGEFRISPDGKSLLLTIHNGVIDDLWSFDLERKILNRLTDEGNVWSPIWSPDGKKIFYISLSTGKTHLTELTLDGMRTRIVTYLPSLFQLNGFVSGGRMIMIAERDGNENIAAIMDSQSGQVREVTRSSHELAFPTVSPNGKWLAYVSDETGRWEIYVRSLGDGAQRRRVTTDGGEEPIWDKTGRLLFYRNGNRWMKVEISAAPVLEASEPELAFSGPYVNIPGYSYDVAPDGRFLVLQSDYQEKQSTALEIVENWPALLSNRSQ